MTMTIPAIPGPQQPIAVTRRPVTAQNAQFGVAPPSMAGDRRRISAGQRAVIRGIFAMSAAQQTRCRLNM
jgi:hypothetical protein